MKLSAKCERQIKCIVGLCNHTYEDKICLWNKIAEAKDPREAETKILRKLISDEINVYVNRNQKSKSK